MRPLRALLVNDASLSGHHGSGLVTDQAVRLAGEAGIALEHGWNWSSVERALQDPASRKPYDLVIVNGEGSIHGDTKAALRIAGIATALSTAGVPVYLVNATVEGTPPEVTGTLRGFRRIFVRDNASRAFLADAGVGSATVPDLTLSFTEAPRAVRQGTLLVTDSSETRKTAELLALARRWPSTTAITMRAEPPWPRNGSTRRRWSFEVKRLLSKPLPVSPWSLRYAGAVRTRAALLDIMGRQSRGAICGRYHAVCFALLTRLPFVAVAGNTSKVAALLGDIGLASRHRTLAALANEDPARLVPDFTSEEEGRIETFLAKAQEDASKMFRAIARDAGDAKAQR